MKETVLVLGSGPIRIGQGIEFDYSCVHCVWALREMGFRAIILNNNPETVSTDFDTGDGLYFEPVTRDSVLAIAGREPLLGVVCQFGGQTAINLADSLEISGMKVLGTSPHAIALAEDRELFEALLQELGVKRPAGRAVRSLAEARETIAEIGYPVLVRPSFVLGGRAMEIVHGPEQLEEFYQAAEEANPGEPVLVDRYIVGQEAEVDVISDGEDTLVPGIMEHIERAGVHSGDSMAIYPPRTLSRPVQREMVEVAQRIAKRLGVKGLMNIQFVIEGEDVYVIEVNPRASRTVPYLSKVTGIPMVQLATRCMMGQTLSEMGYSSGLWCSDGTRASTSEPWQPRVGGRVLSGADYATSDARQSPLWAVKAPVFSFQKLRKVEPSLGPEMKSTGEVMGVDRTAEAALYKALVASGIQFKPEGVVVVTLNDHDKEHGREIVGALQERGYRVATTDGTNRYLADQGIATERVNKIQEGGPTLLDMVAAGAVSLMINTPGPGANSTEEAKQIRRACIETGVVCITNVDTARALAAALELFNNPDACTVEPYTRYREQQPAPVS